MNISPALLSTHCVANFDTVLWEVLNQDLNMICFPSPCGSGSLTSNFLLGRGLEKLKLN